MNTPILEGRNSYGRSDHDVLERLDTTEISIFVLQSLDREFALNKEPLKLKFSGALVEQRGAQLYPSATATVADLISNAWDADASNVWVTIPFGQSWTADDEIEVLDDGHGMTSSRTSLN